MAIEKITPVEAELYRLYAWRIQQGDSPSVARAHVATRYDQASKEQIGRAVLFYQKGSTVGERIANLLPEQTLAEARGKFETGYQRVGVRVVFEQGDPEHPTRQNVLYLDFPWTATMQDVIDAAESWVDENEGQSGNSQTIGYRIDGPTWIPAMLP